MRFRTNNSARVRAHRLLLLVATLISMAIVLGGCDEDISGSQDGPAEITGSYALADVGGNPLPTSIYDGPWQLNGQRVNVQLEMRSSTLQLGADERYLLQMQLAATVEGTVVPISVSDQGGYSRTGERIEFRSVTDGGNFTGNLRNSGLTILLDLVGDQHPPSYLFRK